MQEICQTERLVLRQFAPSDVEPLMAVLGDPEVMRFSLAGPKSRDEIVQWLDWQTSTSLCNLPSQYAVLRRHDCSFIGFSGLLPFNDPDGDAGHEVSYRFRSDCWNQGFGTEALRACLAHGFTHFKLPAVLAVVEKANIGSVRVLEKAGFRLLKKTLYHEIPVKKYLMKREDFQQMHAEASDA